MNNKNTCYEQTEEHLKEYAQRCYHLVNYKVKATEYYKKITNKGCKNKHDIFTEIFQKKKRLKKKM